MPESEYVLWTAQATLALSKAERAAEAKLENKKQAEARLQQAKKRGLHMETKARHWHHSPRSEQAR